MLIQVSPNVEHIMSSREIKDVLYVKHIKLHYNHIINFEKSAHHTMISINNTQMQFYYYLLMYLYNNNASK